MSDPISVNHQKISCEYCTQEGRIVQNTYTREFKKICVDLWVFNIRKHSDIALSVCCICSAVPYLNLEMCHKFQFLSKEVIFIHGQLNICYIRFIVDFGECLLLHLT
jgi:hypothetical protein